MSIGCASNKQIVMLNSGANNWNKWREENKTVRLYLISGVFKNADLRGANLERADLSGCSLAGAHFDGADLREVKFSGATVDSADFSRADMVEIHLGALWGGANISKAKSFYKARLNPEVLEKIKDKWPEKLATIWDETKKGWAIDSTLLEQIKKPDWQGWQEEKSK